MAGIYLHIPFCATRCIYCDFYSQTNTELKRQFVNALCREIELFSSLEAVDPIQTVYWGGGTPSLLSLQELEEIVSCLHKHFAIDEKAEWTLEANPDDVSLVYGQGLADLGFNRVSLGVQSFSDRELSFLGRRHSVQQVYQAIDTLRQNRIDNISIDLIYALPHQSEQQWRENVASALSLCVPHISAYHLICEDGTALAHSVKVGKFHLPEEEVGLQAYAYLVEELQQHGYEQYEVSNFALDGAYSRHNSSYWEHVPYYGLGPSAHSYIPHKRYANVADLTTYLEFLSLGKLPVDFEEILSAKELYNERIMLGLRTTKGVDAELLRSTLGKKFYTSLVDAAKPFCERGLLQWEGNYLRATREGFVLIDGIIRDIFSS